MEAARLAAADDAPAIIALGQQGTASLTTQRGGSIWSQREAHSDLSAVVAAALDGDQHSSTAVVGTIDDVVVGYGLVRMERLHDGAILAVVSDIYVDPEARGVGVGEALMNLMVEQANAAGAVGIDALALPGDRATKNFFETFGLKARAILVHRDLSEGSPEP